MALGTEAIRKPQQPELTAKLSPEIFTSAIHVFQGVHISRIFMDF